MDIPLNAEVQCADGPAGHSTHVILNPVTRQVTHVVVKPDGLFGDADRLVPVDYIIEATPSRIKLRCTKEEMGNMKVFTQIEFIPSYEETPGLMMWPYAEPLQPLPVGRERVPPGELALRRGDHVEATDGRVGHVDEFLIDPKNSQITHLIMREGHLWGKKDVTIPMDQISRIENGTIYLTLDKHSIELLPAIPIRRQQDQKARE